MIEAMSPRRRWVLKAVVEEYVVTAAPVSSETIARKATGRVSTATLRNEMAALEEQGLLQHPHTSSGRVPSDAGYRYYVEHLMQPTDLHAAERRTISHQFHQVEFAIDEWLALARAVLAQALHNAAVVTPPLARHAYVRRIELVPLGEHQLLVIVVLQSGHIRQHVLTTDGPADRDELSQLSERLTARLDSQTVASVRQAAALGPALEQSVLHAVARLMEQAEQQALEEVHYEGIRYIVAQPEFAQSAKLQPLVEALEHGRTLAPVLSEALRSGGVSVVIGQEQPHAAMRECSVVLSGYGPDDGRRGVVGIVGPTRMPYWRAVPLVRFVGSLIDGLVRESFR